MIIQSLEIENFGVFRSKHHFNLAPNLKENKPIILFGGLNGAGKTTLFEGIKLCLYGQPILKEFSTKKEYNSYLFKKIRSLNPESEKIQFSAIELNIEFNNFGASRRKRAVAAYLHQSPEIPQGERRMRYVTQPDRQSLSIAQSRP